MTLSLSLSPRAIYILSVLLNEEDERSREVPLDHSTKKMKNEKKWISHNTAHSSSSSQQSNPKNSARIKYYSSLRWSADKKNARAQRE